MDHTEKAVKAGARSTQLEGRRHGNEKLPLPQHQTNGETFVSALEQKETLKEREGEGEGISKKVNERDIELKAFFHTLQAARKGVLQSLKSHKAAIEMFLPALLESLAPIDRTQSRKLLKRLSTMVQQGAPPSFADAGARSGYIRRRMEHRSAQIAIFLQHPYLQHVCDAMAQAPARTRSCIAAGTHSCIAQAASSFIHSHPVQRGASKQSPSHTDTEQIKENEAHLPPFCVASIGGGGGSDAVGLIIFRNFLREKPTALKGVDRALCVWVYDVEEGWKEAVEEIPCTMRRVGIQCQFDQVNFAKCDCIESLEHGVNHDVLSHVPSFDLVIFSFVLAENARALEVTQFGFLKQLLESLKTSATILILDCTFKLFPEIEALAAARRWRAQRPMWDLNINGHCKCVLVLSRQPPSLTTSPVFSHHLTT